MNEENARLHRGSYILDLSKKDHLEHAIYYWYNEKWFKHLKQHTQQNLNNAPNLLIPENVLEFIATQGSPSQQFSIFSRISNAFHDNDKQSLYHLFSCGNLVSAFKKCHERTYNRILQKYPAIDCLAVKRSVEAF